MSSKKKKQPSSYRAPAQAEPRKGLLDSILAPRPPGASPMPKFRSTFARGATTTFTIVPLLVGIPVLLLALWVFLTAFGFEGPLKTLSAAFAIPPVTSWFDPQVASRTFRAEVDATGFLANIGPLAAILGAVVFHAAVTAIVATLSVEQLRTGSVSAWAVRRAARVLPTTIAVGFIALGFYIFGNVLLAILGSLGFVVGLLGSMALGVYLFGFAPAIAAFEDRRLADTLARSVRAARMPGSGNLWLAMIYAVLSLVSFLLPLPGSGVGVNASVAAWAVVMVLSLAHVVVQSTLAYRYLAVASEVPEQPPARERAARR